MVHPLLSVLFSLFKSLSSVLDSTMSSFYEEKCFPLLHQGATRVLAAVKTSLVAKRKRK